MSFPCPCGPLSFCSEWKLLSQPGFLNSSKSELTFPSQLLKTTGTLKYKWLTNLWKNTHECKLKQVICSCQSARFCVVYFLGATAQEWQESNKFVSYSLLAEVLIGVIFLEGNLVTWIKSLWHNESVSGNVKEIIWNKEKSLSITVIYSYKQLGIT